MVAGGGPESFAGNRADVRLACRLMVSRCARCGSPAATYMTFDYAARAVWLEDLGTTHEGPGHALCVDHADRLTPPMGWTLTDRRSVTPLFAFDVA